jgi:Helix-turn-helix domain
MSFQPTREVAMVRRLTLEQRRQIRRLAKEGMPLAKVAREVGCYLNAVGFHARRKEDPDRTAWSPRGRLALLDREEIFLGIACGETTHR